MVDVFHTLFGLAGKTILIKKVAFLILTLLGLSLLGYEGLNKVNPNYCMTERVLTRVLNKKQS
jgi:prenyltransferase beta subunit